MSAVTTRAAVMKRKSYHKQRGKTRPELPSLSVPLPRLTLDRERPTPRRQEPLPVIARWPNSSSGSPRGA
jgi:hypothetical protein